MGEQKQNNLKKVLGVELQRKENNLARASWKYHFFRKNEIEHYVNYLADDIKPVDAVVYRHNTITKLNYFIPTTINSGKVLVDKNFTKYHIGCKIGQFTKSRKPFYFRSKKKNVTKKYYIPQYIGDLTNNY